MTDKPLTHKDIVRILGPIDDETAVAIIETGANAAQVEEARLWAAGESDAMGEARKPLVGAAAAVYDILVAAQALDEEP